jgi:small subunit ribosomal protein S5
VVAVGNEAGYVGLGFAKAKQMREAIDKAVVEAKLNIIPARLGCGSWECRCGRPHSVPIKAWGKAGSVEMILMPAPRGTGLVAGDTAKIVLRLAGVKDVWTLTKGETRTKENMAKATLEALRNTLAFKSVKDWART